MKTYTERIFGHVKGQDVIAYHFETDAGYQLEVMNYGATILRYVTPDKKGHFANVQVLVLWQAALLKLALT